jgi:flagellar hook-associated protein 3 FlgL
MRIDSMTYLNTSLPGIQNNQSAIARLNQQIGTGLSMLNAKDDPVTATKALELGNRVALRTQYAANQDKLELDLKYQNVVTKEMDSALNRARGLLTSISPSHTASLRNVHAEQLKTVFNHLLSLANTRDPAGNYIFAGFETATQPYANSSAASIPATVLPTTYNGTPVPGGLRNIEVENGRYIQANDNLDQVFKAGVVGSDLLQELGDAIVNLQTGGTITEADLDGYVALLDSAVYDLGLIQHRAAGALTEIKDLRASTEALMLAEKNMLSDITQVDKAAAIVELQSRQTSLEAISRAYSITSGLSLFNYLS